MRIAVDQWRPVTGGVAEGLARLERAALRASGEGADILVLPEMALTGYNIGAEAVRAVAEHEAGAIEAALAAIARRNHIGLVAGYPRPDGAGGCLNAARFVGPDGTTLARYAKTHLYGSVDRTQFVAGPALSPVVELGGWRFGLAICYDIEFPELARSLALAGAEAILVPTANMSPYASIPTRLVPARAEENAIYVAYANYCGGEAEFDYVGLSCICAPSGDDLARAGGGEEMLSADLDRVALERARTLATHLDDRRPDLYAALSSPGDTQ
jgi:predicted amidohydrolase